MSTFSDANPRQQDILNALGRRLGFSTSDITAITYTADIPVAAVVSNVLGTYTALFEGPPLGGIITRAERDALRAARLGATPAPGNVNSPGRSNTPPVRTFVPRPGRY